MDLCVRQLPAAICTNTRRGLVPHLVCWRWREIFNLEVGKPEENTDDQQAYDFHPNRIIVSDCNVRNVQYPHIIISL